METLQPSIYESEIKESASEKNRGLIKKEESAYCIKSNGCSMEDILEKIHLVYIPSTRQLTRQHANALCTSIMHEKENNVLEVSSSDKNSTGMDHDSCATVSSITTNLENIYTENFNAVLPSTSDQDNNWLHKDSDENESLKISGPHHSDLDCTFIDNNNVIATDKKSLEKYSSSTGALNFQTYNNSESSVDNITPCNKEIDVSNGAITNAPFLNDEIKGEGNTILDKICEAFHVNNVAQDISSIHSFNPSNDFVSNTDKFENGVDCITASKSPSIVIDSLPNSDVKQSINKGIASNQNISIENKRQTRWTNFFPRHLFGRKEKTTAVEVPSTTALILEQRPQFLPNKDPAEELKHRQQYELMVEAARKKELKDSKMRRKLQQQQRKTEDALAAATKVWQNEILPAWESMRLTPKTRELWWKGIPPSVRGIVWKLAIGNQLNITPELYEICQLRANDRLKLLEVAAASANSDSDSISSYSLSESSVSKEASVELIKLDVSRTFPHLCIFQSGGPYHDPLKSLLGAYVCYRPDVGYVQGMSFVAAVLLLNMDVDDAFVSFANLLNCTCQRAFFCLDESMMKAYFTTYEDFLLENLPKLYNHFKKLGITPDLYIIDWMFTLYTKSLPLDVASRVWDMFFLDGEEFLFRTALGILRLYEDILLKTDFIVSVQFLTRLPENISSDQLFDSIDNIHMFIAKKRFQQIFAFHRDAIRDTPAS